MITRTDKILTAAFALFLRYGVSRTTMNDIAREAGIARQTLYNTYSNKDEVLRATVQFVVEQDQIAILAAWQDAPTLAAKIDLYFQLGPIKWYEVIQTSPDAADLLDGIHSVAQVEMARMADRFVEMLANMLLDAAPSLLNTTPDADQLAEFLYSTSVNAKTAAPSKQVFLQRLDVLQKAVLGLVNA